MALSRATYLVFFGLCCLMLMFDVVNGNPGGGPGGGGGPKHHQHLKPLYKRWFWQSRNSEVVSGGSGNAMVRVLDVGRVRSLALGAPNNFYTQERLDALEAEAFNHFEERFGLTFTKLPAGYYASAEGNVVVYPTLLGGPDYRLIMSSTRPEVAKDQDWFVWNIGFIGAFLTAGNFTGGIEQGRKYDQKSVLTYGDTLHVKYGANWTDSRYYDVYATFANMVGYSIINSHGLEDFHVGLNYIDRTTGDLLYSWDDTWYESHIVPGKTFSREHEMIAQFYDESGELLPYYPPNGNGHGHGKRSLGMPPDGEELDMQDHPYLSHFQKYADRIN